MTLKDVIRELCKTKHTSIPKLENILGFGSGTIVRWDKSSPSIDKLLKVADYFHVSVDYLIGRTKKELDVIPPSSKANENTIQLSTDEQELLKLYRELPYEGQVTVKTIAKTQHDLYVKPKCNEKAI